MSPRGDLKFFPLPVVILGINKNKQSGILIVKSEIGTGQIFFQEGEVVGAMSPLKAAERLGDVLRKQGILSAEHLQEALKKQKKEGKKRLGQILIALTPESTDEIKDAIRYQTEESFFDLMGWKVGIFDFKPEEFFGDDLVFLDPKDLLAESTRRVSNIIQKYIDDFFNQDSISEEKIIEKLRSIFGIDYLQILNQIASFHSINIPPVIELPNKDFDKNLLEFILEQSNANLIMIMGLDGGVYNKVSNEIADDENIVHSLATQIWRYLSKLYNQQKHIGTPSNFYVKFEKEIVYVLSLTENFFLVISGDQNFKIEIVMALFNIYRRNILDLVKS